MSIEMGIKLKPVTNVSRLSDGIFTFEDRGSQASIDTRKVFEGLEVGKAYAGPYYFGIAKKDSVVKRFGAQFRPVVLDKVKRPGSRIRS